MDEVRAFYIKIVVAPEARGQGLGAQMYADGLSTVRRYGATHLESMAREGDLVSLGFAERCGFKIERHSFESTLDLADFDEHRFDDLMARVCAQGFRFFSLAEAGKTVFTLEDKALLWQEPGTHASRVRLSYYVRRGKLHRIRKGLYAKDKN